MARAKQTDRTEARRRHRAELARAAEAGDAGAAPPAGTGAPAAPSAEPARPGIRAAFRDAFRPLDLRGDLAHLPRVLTNWAVVLSGVVAIASATAFVATTNELAAAVDFTAADPLGDLEVGTATQLSYFFVSLFVVPPPAAGAFLVGFAARRASWLGGLAFGLAAAIAYALILGSPAGRILTGGADPGPYVTQALAVSPLGSAFFASTAAWYRRFLDLANPNRGARRARPQDRRQGGRARRR